jgi:hypothetical protein
MVKGRKDPVTVPAFSYAPNDGLAQLIVEAWSNKKFREDLLDRDSHDKPTDTAVAIATAAINASGTFSLKRAVVITEFEHDHDYTSVDKDEVVFVLPDQSRVAGTGSLLNTARLLMACTPHGI